MKPFSKLLLLCSFLLAIPAFSSFRSKYVDVSKEGGVIADDQGRLGFVQIITNESQQTLWVTVRQGECESTQKIEPKAHALFRCDVGELKPGKVPVATTIYADEAKSQTLESLRDEMSFSLDDARIAQDFAAAQRLPVTYEGIYYAPEFGVKAAFRQFRSTADGKLTISTSTLEYVDGKQKVSIPTAMMRDVHLFRGGNQPWAVVNYLEGDARKHAGFAPLSHPNDLPRIVFSLMAAMKSGGDGTPKISVNYAIDPKGGTNIAIEKP